MQNRNYIVGDTILVIKGKYIKHRGIVTKIYDKYNRVAVQLDNGLTEVLGQKEVTLARKDKLD